MSNELYVLDLHTNLTVGVHLASLQSSNLHPSTQICQSRLAQARSEIRRLESNISIRPVPSQVVFFVVIEKKL